MCYLNLIEEINMLRIEINRFLLSNVFNSVKEISRLRTKINRLLSIKVIQGLKNLSPGHFWGAPTHADMVEF